MWKFIYSTSSPGFFDIMQQDSSSKPTHKLASYVKARRKKETTDTHIQAFNYWHVVADSRIILYNIIQARKIDADF